MERRILRMIQQFKLTLQDESIESYFQIPYATFHLQQINLTTFHFTIQQETIPKLTVDLPSELRVYIGGFLYENKVAVFELTFPSDYPFKPTKWSVVHQYHTDTCEKVVHYQNYRYDVSWSPAITLEKDLLNMIDAYFYNA